MSTVIARSRGEIYGNEFDICDLVCNDLEQIDGFLRRNNI